MSQPFARLAAFAGGGALLLAVLAATGAAWSTTPPTAPGFAAETARAMDRMMAGMAAPPTGAADRDFVAAMVPHHQGAIDMAVAELRFGRDETLRRLAQEIVVEQQQEIVAMQRALALLPRPARPASLVPADICTTPATGARAMSVRSTTGDR